MPQRPKNCAIEINERELNTMFKIYDVSLVQREKIRKLFHESPNHHS